MNLSWHIDPNLKSCVRLRLALYFTVYNLMVAKKSMINPRSFYVNFNCFLKIMNAEHVQIIIFGQLFSTVINCH